MVLSGYDGEKGKPRRPRPKKAGKGRKKALKKAAKRKKK